MSSEKELRKGETAKARARVLISGVVQGVFFRAYARDRAEMLRLKGWVRNQADGTVEALVEGDSGRVQEFIEWCRHGPSSARVEQVDVRWEEFSGEFDSFMVKF